MPQYQTYKYEQYTVTTAPFIEGDEPITERYTRRVKGPVVEVQDRRAAIDAARALHGRDSAGVERVGVRCQFCEDTSAPTLRPGEQGVYCPRCTDMLPADPAGINA